MKNRFCFPTPAARSAVALHTANLQQAIEAPSCAGAPSSPTGSWGGGSATPHVTCPEVLLMGSARCLAAGARVRPGQVGKTLRKEEVVF